MIVKENKSPVCQDLLSKLHEVVKGWILGCLFTLLGILDFTPLEKKRHWWRVLNRTVLTRVPSILKFIPRICFNQVW